MVSAVDPGNLKEPVYSSEENIMETFTKYLPTKYLSETFTSYLSQCKNKGSQEKKKGIFFFFWLEILVCTVEKIWKDLNCSHANSFPSYPWNPLSLCKFGNGIVNTVGCHESEVNLVFYSLFKKKWKHEKWAFLQFIIEMNGLDILSILSSGSKDENLNLIWINRKI